jgi:phosphoglucomutase
MSMFDGGMLPPPTLPPPVLKNPAPGQDPDWWRGDGTHVFGFKHVPTKPYAGQKCGTSGLRKKVKEFQQPHYLENFVQGLFNCLPLHDLRQPNAAICIGGDGRFWNKEAIQVIIKMCAANGLRKVIVGQNGILSTPAVSACIRHSPRVLGGIILTASHNPGGPDADFGIKYNGTNGGPAPESFTDKIYEETKNIVSYRIAAGLPDIDLTRIAYHRFAEFDVNVVDSNQQYISLISSVFDFKAIRTLLSRPDFKMRFDAMNAVTGAYAPRLFCECLLAPEGTVIRSEVLPDFGGHHPDPNLTYAKELVDMAWSGNFDFAAASDGDGDRNMILGRRFFVTPSDSLAIIAANAKTCIPYFKHQGLRAICRSMPTSCAADRVAKSLGITFYEVPTGWKFFGNLMEHYVPLGGGVLCGEESFGTGSDHLREKDGLWAVLCWLSILAHKNEKVPEGGKLVAVEDVVRDHWKQFGRNYYSRYDYEEVESAAGEKVMQAVQEAQVGLVGKQVIPGFTVSLADNFQYKDLKENAITRNQGLRILFSDGSRIVFRLSGTGSSGATIRVYFERYAAPTQPLDQEPATVLQPLIAYALKISQLEELTGRTRPTVIT